MDAEVRETILVDLADLKPHPRNYRDHPQDQIEHLKKSILDNGFYRNIVIAREDTILAGHGIAKAARQLEIIQVPAIRLNIEPDSPAALKLLAADNYLSYFAEDDDRALTELLKDIADGDTLLGTGFDDSQLAALVMVTRPAAEIADFDAAAEWVGMPFYESREHNSPSLVIHFDSVEARAEYVEEQGLTLTNNNPSQVASTHWPPRPKNDTINLLIEG